MVRQRNKSQIRIFSKKLHSINRLTHWCNRLTSSTLLHCLTFLDNQSIDSMFQTIDIMYFSKILHMQSIALMYQSIYISSRHKNSIFHTQASSSLISNPYTSKSVSFKSPKQNQNMKNNNT